MLKVDLQTEQAIQYLIRNLEIFEQNKALREGLRDAARIFEREGRSNLLSAATGVASGEMLRGVSSRIRVSRKASEPTVVGFRRPRGNLAHLVDLGTKERFYKKIGKNGKRKSVGRMPANYFFTDARIEGEKPAMDAIYDGIQRAIDRINSGR